ncbi:MAG: AraC family transcriptional regulator [Gorillibacterium sp.]|nr:AraC family transcriptional regulator [Gorillibacterium sp.]
MDHHLLETINHTTEYIENHLFEDLNLDAISEHVNISKFHLLRIWKGATSTGLMEYVRRRRIALSLGDLITDRNHIEFISGKYSFGSERAYNRVFKEEYNITPAKWRRNPTPLSILDRFNADFISLAGEGLVFFRSITVLPAFSIAGLEFIVDTTENVNSQIATQHGVDFFYKDRPRIMNPLEKDVYIGFTSVPDPFTGYTIYQPSVQINHNSIIPPDMTVKRVKPHKYGVFTYMGPHRPEEISAKSLSSIWNYVFQKWMPTVQFNLKENFSFESINYAKCNKQYCECDLYFPISVL